MIQTRSNVALRVFPGLEHHNLRRLFHAGICVPVNSGDPTYFRGHVSENLIPSAEGLGRTAEEQLTLADNGLRAAFVDEDRRKTNRKVIKGRSPLGLAAVSYNET
ncbi:hypothetical protein AB4Z40_09045 [Bosea sp. 2YAB26]|uniref:hypothetical protein n=1 Tax=Bosea sp. 2YAB26 TaxID=3237478 RepID=UPI003F8E5DE4